ncbi:MAG: hypothetical protein KGO01_21685, partial [Burkholderiales bacterium]|nr:hypothetical protein [Burkholderiales bacterium]
GGGPRRGHGTILGRLGRLGRVAARGDGAGDDRVIGLVLPSFLPEPLGKAWPRRGRHAVDRDEPEEPR